MVENMSQRADYDMNNSFFRTSNDDTRTMCNSVLHWVFRDYSQNVRTPPRIDLKVIR